MPIESEPIGSIPRPVYLVEPILSGNQPPELMYDKALAETVQRFIETGSKVITDGEQLKPSFLTYPIQGSNQLQGGGVEIPFADNHKRQLPVLSGQNLPFKYNRYAREYLDKCRQCATGDCLIKVPIISASAMSLLYPMDREIPGYPRTAFIADMLNEVEKDIRKALEGGAHVVQIDATELRLSLKLDPSGALLRSFVDLNNQVFNRFTPEERAKLGIHTCPGGDMDSTHSADIDYLSLLPTLFNINVKRFYLQYASEIDRKRVLECVRENVKPDQLLFFGVTDVINPRVETAEEVCDTILEISKYIPINQIGTTDDCGFSPFCDDQSTSRDIAFAKIKARIDGTRMAEQHLGL
ncbi:hypothetical protein SAMD00019534_110680 [Acytostelium subglobosum LB1]|uniref:hypothetical protein n=1 Tax=Acytostelium subglobosum LB1 TaxID=1410327 RepID=UPI000644E2B9|nr:hypothetical protein SAMD00019534_110680 [Acytostelium subglobosum LB1]GAM27892.1 hypothetical protein SAMD00019534_110680 [Acytostelium subglobosum LB1]|eukprot:XP_012749175.1 hypothetical protein SAMD00019534_110680 [Acytostelium subglobosum LB1]